MVIWDSGVGKPLYGTRRPLFCCFPPILIGLCNDELGYIVPEYDFRSDEYEKSMCQRGATAPIVRETAIRLLTGVK